MNRVLGVLCGALLVLSGCSSTGDADVSASPTIGDISMIEVGASDTLAPALSWPEGIDFTRIQSTVMWDGEGELLVDGQPLLLDMYVQSLDTGTILENTYDALPRSFLLAPEFLGDDLYNVLLTARVGTRVVSVAPPAGEFEDEPAIAIVIDVLSDRAVGERQEANPALPSVSLSTTGEPEITLKADQLPQTDLTISTLIQGDGEQIRPGSYIVAQTKVVYAADGSVDEKSWAAGDVRQTSWSPEQAPFEGQVGVGNLPRALDEGLIDQTSGSQVMIVAPEGFAYAGEGTLIYVIDILDVLNKEA